MRQNSKKFKNLVPKIFSFQSFVMPSKYSALAPKVPTHGGCMTQDRAGVTAGDRPTIFIEIIQRVGCMPGDTVSTTNSAKIVREQGERTANSGHSLCCSPSLSCALKEPIFGVRSLRHTAMSNPLTQALGSTTAQVAPSMSPRPLAAEALARATSMSCSSALKTMSAR